MNLEVRNMRQEKDPSQQNKELLKQILDRTQLAAKIKIEDGKWCKLRVRIKGDIMKAFLDDVQVTSLRSPGFDHPTKTKLGFTVNGGNIEFDNLRIRKPE